MDTTIENIANPKIDPLKRQCSDCKHADLDIYSETCDPCIATPRKINFVPAKSDITVDNQLTPTEYAQLHQVGDVNSAAKGSGARYNAGKPDFSLIPLCTLEDEARVWEYGKRKYAAWNWAKGMDWDVVFACAMRHMAAWQRGEENDPESGLPHLAHAMCNLRMLTLFSRTYREGDHRPTEWLGDWSLPKPV
jgi:hypothetical protein